MLTRLLRMGSMFCGLRRMAFANREEGGESSGPWQAATPEAAASAVVDALRHLVALSQGRTSQDNQLYY